MKNKLESMIILFSLFFILPSMTGCGLKTMGDTEVGEVYSTLPDFLGGGYKGRVEPGTWKLYSLFWTDIYTIPTGQQTVTWSEKGQGDDPNINDALNTRAGDGNEVWLSITTQYHIDPLKTKDVLLNVGYKDENIETAVEDYGRSKIRSCLGELQTDEFYDNNLRFGKTGDAKKILSEKLSPYGIIIDNVNLDGHRFADDYQRKIDETKRVEQDAQRAFNSIATMKTQKKQELQNTIGDVNKQVADAEGKENQAKLKGDAYFTEKENNTLAITVEGQKTAEGIAKEIASLKNAGGESLVRLKIGQQLIASGAPFYLVNRGEGSGDGNLDMSKLDYNEFLSQIGKMSLAGENIFGAEHRHLKP